MTKSQYTTEEMQKFQEMHDALIEEDKHIDKVMGMPQVYQRRHFIVHGVEIAQIIKDYREKVPDEVRADFGFDEGALVKKVEQLFRPYETDETPSFSE